MKYLATILMVACGWIFIPFQITPADEFKVELRSELLPICACESMGDANKQPSQFDESGNVIVSSTNDIGMCQINLFAHKENADKMGLDLFKEKDNIIYANWLYGQQGSQPWSWSASCWMKNYAKK